MAVGFFFFFFNPLPGLHRTGAAVVHLEDCEVVWPSSEALGWNAEGPRFESASALLSLK